VCSSDLIATAAAPKTQTRRRGDMKDDRIRGRGVMNSLGSGSLRGSDRNRGTVSSERTALRSDIPDLFCGGLGLDKVGLDKVGSDVST
jgi:hypothetical protein